ncbi:MAG: heme-binding protein [Thiobacillus sp.]
MPKSRYLRRSGHATTAVRSNAEKARWECPCRSHCSRFRSRRARKAGMSVVSVSDSGEFRSARGDIRPELNHIDGLIVTGGALPIRAGGSLVGAIGVSGAPGGDKDAACAAAGLKAAEDHLEFAP